MGGRKDVGDLQLRKRVLILESNLNRAALQAEWQNIRTATAWVGQAAQTLQVVKPWLPLLAPLAGILAVRGVRQPVRVLSRLMTALKWVGPVLAAWKSYSGRDDRSRPPAAS
jgi:hypothetical protein